MSDIESEFVAVDIDDEPPETPGYDPDDPTTWPPDPETAPYGYKANGEPYKRRPNGQGGSKPKLPGKKGRRGRKHKVDYAGIVNDLIMSIASPLAMVGTATGNVPMMADAWILSDRAEPIGEAIGELAQQNARIADALERLAEATPYAALTAAVLPIIPQVLVNHGVMQPGVMGTVDPMAIATQMTGRSVPQPARVNGDGAPHITD